MRCEDAQQAFVQTPQDDAVQAHVQDCATCAEFVRTQALLNAVLALDEDAPPGPGFDTRFAARLAEARQAQQRPWWQRLPWLVPLVAASGVAAAVALTWTPQPSRPPGDAPDPHAQATTVSQPPVPPTDQVPGPPPDAADDLMLARELELLEAMSVVQRLDELEAYEALAQLDDAEIDALLAHEEAL